MFEIIDQPGTGAIIKVIGVGGCGGNAVEHMIEHGVQGVEFICVNTDAQALKRSTARNQLQLGALTQRPGRGRQARDRRARRRWRTASASTESIAGADMLFITAGMGGGTGTGAAPVIAEIAASWASSRSRWSRGRSRSRASGRRSRRPASRSSRSTSTR